MMIEKYRFGLWKTVSKRLKTNLPAQSKHPPNISTRVSFGPNEFTYFMAAVPQWVVPRDSPSVAQTWFLGEVVHWAASLDWQELHWVGPATVKTKIQKLSWKYTMLSLKFDAATGEMRRVSIEYIIGISVKSRALVQVSKLIKRSSI